MTLPNQIESLPVESSPATRILSKIKLHVWVDYKCLGHIRDHTVLLFCFVLYCVGQIFIEVNHFTLCWQNNGIFLFSAALIPSLKLHHDVTLSYLHNKWIGASWTMIAGFAHSLLGCNDKNKSSNHSLYFETELNESGWLTGPIYCPSICLPVAKLSQPSADMKIAQAKSS